MFYNSLQKYFLLVLFVLVFLGVVPGQLFAQSNVSIDSLNVFTYHNLLFQNTKQITNLKSQSR